MIEHIGFGTAQVRPGTDRVRLRPGERLMLGLGVTASSREELQGATASVWTNIDASDPAEFRALPMAGVVPSDGHMLAFQATLPPARPGTYVATAYVSLDGTRHWAQDFARGVRPHNLHNRLVFRVSPAEVDGLLVRQVPLDKANARSDSTDISTLEDMLEPGNGWYTLRRLADEGVNCVWLQVPYRLDVWDGIDAIDEAGSDYASNDWFAIDPQLSRDARLVPAWDLDRQRTLANDAMRRFVDEAHALGMKVISGIAPNHVGHNYIFRDAFGPGASEGVHRRDYSQLTVGTAQAAEVAGRLASADLDEAVKNYAEWMLPQMYAGKYPDGSYNPFGAASLSETYSPDWYGLWRDTKHLNHGGHAGQRIWYPRTEQNYRVLAYIGRAMLWGVTDLGFDGFRVDHALGMPYHFYEQTLPWVESQARRRRGDGFSLLLVHEDHDRKDYSARVGDVIQSMAYKGLLDDLARQDVEAVWGWYGDPDPTEEFTGTGNHDEERGSVHFGGNLLAYGNAVLTMILMGGAMTMLAGDEFAEGQRLRFKAKGGRPDPVAAPPGHPSGRQPHPRPLDRALRPAAPATATARSRPAPAAALAGDLGRADPGVQPQLGRPGRPPAAGVQQPRAGGLGDRVVRAGRGVPRLAAAGPGRLLPGARPARVRPRAAVVEPRAPGHRTPGRRPAHRPAALSDPGAGAATTALSPESTHGCSQAIHGTRQMGPLRVWLGGMP